MAAQGGLGCRGHDFGQNDLAGLAELVTGKGFDCLQLAPAKAIAGFTELPGGRIDPGFASRATAAFQARGLRISVLGCYINPIHPDPDKRRAQLDRFKAYLQASVLFGTPIVATETGSLNADCSAHPGNGGKEAFEALVASVAGLAAAAEEAGAIACLEGVTSHVAGSPARLARVLKAVASPSLKVILDPVNFLDASNLGRAREIIEEAFELLGPDILVLHAKDCRLDGGSLRILPAGQGILDYGSILSALADANPQADILLEDLRPADMDGARGHILARRPREAGIRNQGYGKDRGKSPYW
jgi:L-ribulose-5-phosphate 3-epimerase